VHSRLASCSEPLPVSEMSLPIFYQTRQLGSDGWRLSFEAHRRGRGRRVFVYPREDGVWFLVRRGEGVLACVDVPGREWVRLREVNFFLGGPSNEVEVHRADSSAGSGCFAVRKTCSRNRLASGRPNSRGCRLPWSRMKVRSQDTSCVVVGSDAPHCRAACATWSSKRGGCGAMTWGVD